MLSQCYRDAFALERRASGDRKINHQQRKKKKTEKKRRREKTPTILSAKYLLPNSIILSVGGFLHQAANQSHVRSFIAVRPAPCLVDAYHYRRRARTTFRIRSFSARDPLNHRV